MYLSLPTSQAPHPHLPVIVWEFQAKISKVRKFVPSISLLCPYLCNGFGFLLVFLSQQYRAYYGAFKLVHTIEGDSEDLRALRFLSVISIVDPWIFIIFRTSVFRMLLHKIFIRPLSYRNWYSHSCQKSKMESALWGLCSSGKKDYTTHSKNHDWKKPYNLNP